MNPVQSPNLLTQYRDNFARHLLGVALHLQSEVMHALTDKHGHSELRISFQPYITLSSQQGTRLSDIAQVLGISRQAANQTTKQIVAAGYLEQCDDPSDGRAKLLQPTAKARDMLATGSRIAMRLQGEMEQIAGQQQMDTSAHHIAKLLAALQLPHLADTNSKGQSTPPMVAALPRLADYSNARLMELTMAKGHPKLKLSFGQVLSAIGPQGGRIWQMAKAHRISKQAIGAIVGELEGLDYIRRTADPRDARQVVLNFTPRGQRLMADSAQSVDELRAEFAQLIGRPAQKQLENTLSRLYYKLQLEEEIFGSTVDKETDIRFIARQLNRQLGDKGANALGKLLVSGNYF